jgi:predicted helicase
MSFQRILENYRKISFSERDKGDRFERLMQVYLQTDPKYAPRFKKVWLWNEFPGKLDLGGGDTVIDIDLNLKKISWSRSLRDDVQGNVLHGFGQVSLRISSYRPFCQQNIYLNKGFNEAIGLSPNLFPNPNVENLVICISGAGVSGEFTVLITNRIPDFHFNGANQAFPIYYYEEQDKQSPTLWDVFGESDYIRRDGVSDFILERAKKMYGKNVSKEDIFYYVYCILHSLEYRSTLPMT